MADWGGLENRCGLMGHRGFESHPLRSTSLRDKKNLTISICQVFLLHVTKLYQEGLTPSLLIRKINPIAKNPTPIRRMINDCQVSGLKIGPITLTLASINS